MIFYKNGNWHLCSEKIKYIQHGEEIIQYVMSEGHDWWVDFEEKWEHTEIVEFISVVTTDEQIARLEEVNQLNIGDGHSSILADYVIRNKFPEEVNHVLRDLQPKKELEKAKQEIAFNNAMSNLENLQLTENIKANLEVAQAEANYELMMLVMTMGGN